MLRTLCFKPSMRHMLSAPSRGIATGLVGLPNVGKSSLFNALTLSHSEVANYPFATIDPCKGRCAVQDPRLYALAKANESVKINASSLEFVDIAGLVEGASQGKGMGNKFLSNVRECDAIIHVVRCYEDEDILHVHNKVNPVSDIDVINLELALSDLSQAEKRYAKVVKLLKNQAKGVTKDEATALEKLIVGLNDGIAGREVKLSKEEVESVQLLHLLTMKPMIYAANVSDEHIVLGNEHTKALKEYLPDNTSVIQMSAQIEMEIARLESEEERVSFMEALGIDANNIDEFGLRRVVMEVHDLLKLQTFFTSGPTETRAWTFSKGSFAPQAAGLIHSDFEKGFIRADQANWKHIVECGSEKAARDKGHWTLQGKEYVVQDGDVLIVRHNA